MSTSEWVVASIQQALSKLPVSAAMPGIWASSARKGPLAAPPGSGHSGGACQTTLTAQVLT